ncbi:hypothetical protein BGZ95_008499 [Linnemannia exigua]|uniref:Uncharacterized protein n=1 Tax=Linnemannia exigua TaxID=604196 RepID=A0AAD4H9R6_9FUNG|nr:hypothetical protein BGZ95_008499 [Linnemannia exigua]
MTTDVAQTKFYGISNAERYQSTGADGFHRNMVLVKSNTSPYNIHTTSWSFISSYSSLNLSVKSGTPVIAGCAVDSRGVVTYVAAHYIYDPAEPYSKYFTALRYDPAGTLDPTLSQGTGSWTTATLNPTFGPMTVKKISLYYTTVEGVETLNMALVDDPVSVSDDSIIFGVYDTATSTFNPTGRWPMPYMTYGIVQAFLVRGNEMYYQTIGASSKLSVYSLSNVATGTPTLLRSYSSPCADSGIQTRLAILQNTLYMICAHKYREPIDTLSIIKDVTKADSKFEPSTIFNTTIIDVEYFVTIGSNNASIGGQPFALIGRRAGYDPAKLQYSLLLAGPKFGIIEGGVDAIIPENFGTDDSKTTSGVYPRPTHGGDGGSGGSGGSGGEDGTNVVVVIGKLPVKIIIIIVVAALFVGCGILALLGKYLGGCCIIIKNAITGETPEIGVVKVENLELPETKQDDTAGSGADGLSYLAPDQQQPPAQDNGLAYLLIENQTAPASYNHVPPSSTPVSAVPLTPSVTDSPPSPSIPRHSRPDI